MNAKYILREEQDDGENYIMWSFVICAIHHIIRMVKSGRMRWTWHVFRIGKLRKAYKVLVGKTEGESRMEDPSVVGKLLNLRHLFIVISKSIYDAETCI
jgi:hypothetical protein